MSLNPPTAFQFVPGQIRANAPSFQPKPPQPPPPAPEDDTPADWDDGEPEQVEAPTSKVIVPPTTEPKTVSPFHWWFEASNT